MSLSSGHPLLWVSYQNLQLLSSTASIKICIEAVIVIGLVGIAGSIGARCRGTSQEGHADNEQISFCIQASNIWGAGQNQEADGSWSARADEQESKAIALKYVRGNPLEPTQVLNIFVVSHCLAWILNYSFCFLALSFSKCKEEANELGIKQSFNVWAVFKANRQCCILGHNLALSLRSVWLHVLYECYTADSLGYLLRPSSLFLAIEATFTKTHRLAVRNFFQVLSI